MTLPGGAPASLLVLRNSAASSSRSGPVGPHTTLELAMIADMASTRRLPFRLNGVWPQTSGLPTMVRAPILPACSSSPRQKPTRSAPPSIREVNCRLLSSCAGCSPASPTTRRRGTACASLPDGCRCRLDRPGCLGAGAGSHSGAVPHCAFGAATAGFRVTTRAGLERITPPARSGRGGARAGRRRECQSAARPTPFSRRNHRAAAAPVDPRCADRRGRRWSCASRRRTAPARSARIRCGGTTSGTSAAARP